MPEVFINNFSGGISEDKRSQDATKFSLTKHFDTWTYPHKLVPQLKTVASDTVTSKAFKIFRFLYAPAPTSSFRFYGLGYQSGLTKAQIYYYSDITSASATWGTLSNSQAANGNLCKDIFFHYKNYLYTYSNGTNLDRFDAVGGGAYGDAFQTISYTVGQTQAQPVHHPADDIAYFFADNIVHKLNGASWSGSVLTLPSNVHIVVACAFGDYLAIGTVTNGTVNIKSTVYLWDRDSSVTTISQKIDFGEGTLRHLEVLDNKLIGIVDNYVTNSLGEKHGKIYIKQASGNSAVILNQLTTDATSGVGQDAGGTIVACTNTRYVKDNHLYFPMAAQLNSDTRMGIWIVDSSGRASIYLVEEEATTYEGIYALGNQWWIAHTNDGSINRSVIYDDGTDLPNYSTTLSSVYESLIQTNGDSSRKKKLVGVTVMYEPLPTAGQVVLKYRKDGDVSWTTIFTDGTDNAISHSAVNIESTGATLPEYKEIEFQINSTGGAVITGLSYKFEFITRRAYE